MKANEISYRWPLLSLFSLISKLGVRVQRGHSSFGDL
jgi:hypothetical protein